MAYYYRGYGRRFRGRYNGFRRRYSNWRSRRRSRSRSPRRKGFFLFRKKNRTLLIILVALVGAFLLRRKVPVFNTLFGKIGLAAK